MNKANYRRSGCVLLVCLAGQTAVAQRTAVAPLPPVVRPTPPASEQIGVAVPQYPPAASASVPPAQRSWPPPVYLLNSSVIVSDLGMVKPTDIANIYVYKGTEVPLRWRSLTEHGIIDITLKFGVKLKLKTKSLAAIQRQAKATGLVSFQLNGMRLEDSSLRVATVAIAGLDVQRDDSATVINIRLVPPKPSPPRHDPPGTIYIRGVAGR